METGMKFRQDHGTPVTFSYQTDMEETVTEWSVCPLLGTSQFAVARRRYQVINELQFAAFPAVGFAGRHHSLAGRTSSLALEFRVLGYAYLEDGQHQSMIQNVSNTHCKDSDYDG